MSKHSDISSTLKERGSRYGDFANHAQISQTIKNAMRNQEGWSRLTDDKREALEMIAHKIGRIINGDPEYKDSWHDIMGYSRLIENTLED